MTGSHCTFAKVIPQIEKIISEGAEVFPVVSYAVSSTDTRFGSSKEWCDKLQDLTKKTPNNNDCRGRTGWSR